MRHPVSTLRSLKQHLGPAVASGIVGFALNPCAPDDTQPSTSEDANGTAAHDARVLQ